MVYSIISCFCILMLGFGSVFVLTKLANRSRKARVEFVRSFKNGRCVFILIPTFFIVLMGLWYDNAGVRSLLRAIPKSMQFVVMGFELEDLQQLMSANASFKFAVYLDCFVIIFNACMVVVSLFKQKVHYAITNGHFCTTKTDIVLLLGNSEKNRCIYSSVPKDVAPFICCPLSKEEMDDLYNEGIEFLTLDEEKVLERICSLVREPEAKPEVKPEEEPEAKPEEASCEATQVCNVFINTGDDTKNILLANNLLSRIKTLAKSSNVAYDKLAVYIFGSSTKRNLFLELEEKGFGCFHFVDEYKLAVLDLIENHPMASFFDERHVDFDTTLVKNVELKVFMIGFGETNTELFLQSVSNDQFTTDGNGAPIHKAVKYYLFDKKKILENSNLNYSYNRYEEFLNHVKKMGLEDQYFKVAPKPAEEYLVPMQDIDCKTFFQNLHARLAPGKNDINLISVALGSDIDSIDIANKIAAKCNEWGLSNTHVCVRVKERMEADNIASRDVLLWGDLETSVFNYFAITRKTLEKMAMFHDGVYDKIAAKKGESSHVISASDFDGMNTFKDIKYRRAWYEVKDRIKRESSFNCCLNFKTKLFLMGINCTEVDALYDVVKKKIGDLSDQAKENLARQEHYRWNAHYICNGYIPVTIKDSKECEKNGRDSKLRKHPNLLEFDALKDYQKLTNDFVVKYDYQVVDELAKTISVFGRV